MLVVLFGLAGAGKTYAGKLLSENSNFHFWDADEALTEEMKTCISEKRSFTQDMRDRYFSIVIERMESLCTEYTNIVVAQAFYKNKNREQVLLKFPDSVFLQVDVEFTTLLNRLRKRNDAVDEEYAIKLSANFEPPIHSYHSINNDIENDASSLIKQFMTIPILAPILTSTLQRKIPPIQKINDQELKLCSGSDRLLPVSQHADTEFCISKAIDMHDCRLKLIKPKSDRLLRAVVVGKTIRYSWSPYIHAFWLKQYNIHGTYHPIEVSERNFATLIRFLRNRGYAGCNIAMPYKQEAFALVDSTDPFSQSVSAINTISIKNGTIHGQNTDSYGFIKSIYESPIAGKEYNFKDKIVVVLGAGGGSRGVCAGLLDEGVERIILINRTLSRALDVQNTFGQSIQVLPWEKRHEALKDIHMLVNTTSLGMVGQEPLDLDLVLLPTQAVVIDIVYKPLITQLLAQAKARGNPTIDGLDMLLHQAVPGFEAWFGVRPRVTSMLREHIINLTSAGFTSRGDFIIPEKFVENERLSVRCKPYAQDDMHVRYIPTQLQNVKFLKFRSCH